MNESNIAIITKSIIGILAGIALILLIPTLSVAIGWLLGAIVAFFFGGMLADGLNLLFGTERFTSGDIPTVTAVLVFLAHFLLIRNVVGKTKGGD